MSEEPVEPLPVSITYDNNSLIKMTHKYIRNYIKVIDRKASILITLLLAIFGLFGSALRTGVINPTPFELTMIGLASFFGSISLILAAWVVYPRANLPEEEGQIYWEKILLHSNNSQFADSILEIEDEQVLRKLSKDTYELAKIASNKYEWLRTAVKFTFIGGFFGAIAGLHGFLSRIHTVYAADQPPLPEWTAAFISVLLALIYIFLISWFISFGDDQINGFSDFWTGQLEGLGGPEHKN